MRRPLVLSIDWDFFVEEDPMLDMGHRETQLHLEYLWTCRATDWAAREKTIEQMMPMRTAVLDFCAGLMAKFNFKKYAIATAESHASIVEAVEQAKFREFDIVNFDAHHDIYYGKIKDKFDCGSWGGYFLNDGRVNKYTQVYPDWRRKFSELSQGGRAMLAKHLGHNWSRVHFDHWKEFTTQRAPRRSVDLLFICRSGCWVPPCYDSHLAELCSFFGGRAPAPRQPTAPRQEEVEAIRRFKGPACL